MHDNHSSFFYNSLKKRSGLFDLHLRGGLDGLRHPGLILLLLGDFRQMVRHKGAGRHPYTDGEIFLLGEEQVGLQKFHMLGDRQLQKRRNSLDQPVRRICQEIG